MLPVVQNSLNESESVWGFQEGPCKQLKCIGAYFTITVFQVSEY